MTLKASDFPKDTTTSIRMRKSFKERLKTQDLSPQKLFDMALDAFFVVTESDNHETYVTMAIAPELKVEKVVCDHKAQAEPKDEPWD